MDPEMLHLVRLLALSGLIGGTIEYSHIVRRRVERRQEHTEELDSGLRALVRLAIAEEQRHAPREVPPGIR
jgi:hypothetical protein